MGFIPSVFAIEDPAKITDIVAIIETVITFLAPAAAIAFLIMILFGGFKFVTSGGDPKATGQAKAILTYAVFGVILVVISWLILLLIQSLTGVDVTKVGIPE